jgi:DNA-binding NarL/FixJ family response regulator
MGVTFAHLSARIPLKASLACFIKWYLPSTSTNYIVHAIVEFGINFWEKWTVAQKVSVCILSDNRLFRESLGRILSKRADLEITTSTGISEIALAEIIRAPVDVVVLDSLNFPILRAAFLKAQADQCHPPKILLVAMEEDQQLFLRAVRAGALGFIPKDASALDVVAAVRSVAGGEAVCPARFCKFLFDFVVKQAVELPKPCAKLPSVLTRRERQLVPMIGRGLTNKEIAKELNLSEQTIKNHVHRILHKVGVQNRLAISTAVDAHGLPN